MRTLTVFLLALIPGENWIRTYRADKEPTLLSWLDENEIELREIEWDGRVDAIIEASLRGEQFAVRVSNYMPASTSAKMTDDRPQPDSLDVVTRTCAALNRPLFYYGLLFKPTDSMRRGLPWNDDGLGRDALIEALSDVLVETK